MRRAYILIAVAVAGYLCYTVYGVVNHASTVINKRMEAVNSAIEGK